ncbi:MAG: tetratricopeptide repeat protein [Candidatus Eisenbacteria bacterium]
MRVRHPLSLSLLALVLASPVSASMGGGGGGAGPSTPPPPSTVETKTEPSAREQAEGYYGQAYEEVARAQKDLADGKDKNAEKRFKRALDWGEKATTLDEKYYEAWNLVGYAARKTGDYDKAFASYDKCLEIKTDYAPAREYLGEAWLDKGDPAKAREQLTLLEKFGAKDDAATLRTAIEAYEAAHPDARKDSTSSK